MKMKMKMKMRRRQDFFDWTLMGTLSSWWFLIWFAFITGNSSCLAWGVIFDRRKDRSVVCVFSIFNAGGSVCVRVCVYTHSHSLLK